MDFKILQIGEAALLEQLAEECVELAHVALKMARIIREENPTPKTLDETLPNLIEEVADVSLCLDVLDGIIDFENTPIGEIKKEKCKRWVKRIEGRE